MSIVEHHRLHRSELGWREYLNSKHLLLDLNQQPTLLVETGLRELLRVVIPEVGTIPTLRLLHQHLVRLCHQDAKTWMAVQGFCKDPKFRGVDFLKFVRQQKETFGLNLPVVLALNVNFWPEEPAHFVGLWKSGQLTDSEVFDLLDQVRGEDPQLGVLQGWAEHFSDHPDLLLKVFLEFPAELLPLTERHPYLLHALPAGKYSNLKIIHRALQERCHALLQLQVVQLPEHMRSDPQVQKLLLDSEIQHLMKCAIEMHSQRTTLSERQAQKIAENQTLLKVLLSTTQQHKRKWLDRVMVHVNLQDMGHLFENEQALDLHSPVALQRLYQHDPLRFSRVLLAQPHWLYPPDMLDFFVDHQHHPGVKEALQNAISEKRSVDPTLRLKLNPSGPYPHGHHRKLVENSLNWVLQHHPIDQLPAFIQSGRWNDLLEEIDLIGQQISVDHQRPWFEKRCLDYTRRMLEALDGCLEMAEVEQSVPRAHGLLQVLAARPWVFDLAALEKWLGQLAAWGVAPHSQVRFFHHLLRQEHQRQGEGEQLRNFVGFLLRHNLPVWPPLVPQPQAPNPPPPH